MIFCTCNALGTLECCFTRIYNSRFMYCACPGVYRVLVKSRTILDEEAEAACEKANCRQVHLDRQAKLAHLNEPRECRQQVWEDYKADYATLVETWEQGGRCSTKLVCLHQKQVYVELRLD